MKNVLFAASACQGVWPMHVGNACGTTGWLIPAYSGLLVDAVHASIGFETEYTWSPKSDPPDYSVAGESTLGTLIIRGEPLSVELRPTKNIIRSNVYHSNSTKRSETFGP